MCLARLIQLACLHPSGELLGTAWPGHCFWSWQLSLVMSWDHEGLG